MTSDEMREAVARVIEPLAFRSLAEHMETVNAASRRLMLSGAGNEEIGRANYQSLAPRRASALAKADAILSMISASPVKEENKRLREALAAIRQLKAEPIGDTGFQTGPLSLFNAAKRIAQAALTNNISTGSPADSETSGGVS